MGRSSQWISGLLMLAPYALEPTVIEIGASSTSGPTSS